MIVDLSILDETSCLNAITAGQHPFSWKCVCRNRSLLMLNRAYVLRFLKFVDDIGSSDPIG